MRGKMSGPPVKQWNTPSQLAATLLLEERKRFVPGVTTMNDDRFVESQRNANLRCERRLLRFPVAVFVKEI